MTKLAIVGSRTLTDIRLEEYIDFSNVTEIVSGGAIGVDTLARNYANLNRIKLTEFLPDYSAHGRKAPLIRNKAIVDYSDKVVAFWDGKSRGTLHTLNYARQTGVICEMKEIRHKRCIL